MQQTPAKTIWKSGRSEKQQESFHSHVLAVQFTPPDLMKNRYRRGAREKSSLGSNNLLCAEESAILQQQRAVQSSDMLQQLLGQAHHHLCVRGAPGAQSARRGFKKFQATSTPRVMLLSPLTISVWKQNKQQLVGNEVRGQTTHADRALDEGQTGTSCKHSHEVKPTHAFKKYTLFEPASLSRCPAGLHLLREPWRQSWSQRHFDSVTNRLSWGFSEETSAENTKIA